MKKNVIFSVFIVFAVLLLISANTVKTIVNSYIQIPENIDFANEQTPTTIPDVKERLDREMLINVHLHSSTILILKRANKYFPIIEPILAKNNVPDDFKYLAVIESSLTNAVSSAGARGFWQFMPETAKQMGLEVSETVDERFHLEKATQLACEYLLKAKAKFGSWTLAAASYNGGMSGIAKHLEFQEVSNYYDLQLTEETSRYVFRILALKQIMKNPIQYGFNLPNSELYQKINTKAVLIDSSITNLAKFAKGQGINYKVLKYHNPWLRDKKLDNPNKKQYAIEIPID